MIERKMQTDKIERRGNELLNSFDNFPINTNTVSTPIVKEKRKKKKQEEKLKKQQKQQQSGNDTTDTSINNIEKQIKKLLN